MRNVLLFLFLTTLLLASCQAEPTMVPTSAPTHLPTQTSVVVTPTRTPTPIPSPSPSPSPTPYRPDLDAITVENIKNLKEEVILGEGKLADVASSEQAGLIGYATQIGIRLIDSQTLAQISFLQSTVPVAKIVFSPDGKLLAAGYESGLIRLFPVDKLSQGAAEPTLEIKAHTFQVTALRFSPDGSMVASGSRDRTVNIWKVVDGMKIRPLGGFALAVSDVAFSADDLTFAAASLDGTTRVWEIRSGKMLNQTGIADKKRIQPELYPSRLLFLANKSVLWLGWANGDIAAWNWEEPDSIPGIAGKLNTGLVDLIWLKDDQLASLDQHGQVEEWQAGKSSIEKTKTIKQIPGAKSISLLTPELLVVGSYPARIERMDLTDRSPDLVFSKTNLASQVTSVVFSTDQHFFISGSGDGVLCIWDVDQPAFPLEWPLDKGKPIKGLVTSPGQKWLAAAYGNRVDIFSQDTVLTAIQSSFQNGLPQPAISIPTSGTAHQISISADGKLLAVSLLLANHIQVYSLPEGTLIGELTKFQHPIEALAFSPIDNSLAAGAKDHRVYVWSPADLAQLQETKTDEGLKPAHIKGGYVVTKLNWSPAGDQLAVIGTFKQAHVNNPLDGQVLYYLNGSTDQITCSAFSPDGSLIAAAGADGILQIYETKHGKLLAELSGHSGMINAIRFSPSGDRIITAGEDGTIRLWSLPIVQQ